MVGRVRLNDGWRGEADGGHGSSPRRPRRRTALERLQALTPPVFERMRHERVGLPFMMFTAILVVTAVFFVGIRRTGVELNIDQRAELERRVYEFPNASVYVSEFEEREGLLSTFTKDEWTEAVDVDYVAFVYDDVSDFLTELWMDDVQDTLSASPVPGLGMALFPCGCLVPNAYFQNVEVRFNGAECLLLPGFVFDRELVFWAPSRSDMPCKKRSSLLGNRYLETFSEDIGMARRAFGELMEARGGGAGEDDAKHREFS